MVRKTLGVELDVEDIAITAMAPGVVDTPMQKSMRGQSIQDFPVAGYFSELERNQQLASADIVANFMVWLLLHTSRKQYAEKELWDFFNAKHRALWKNWRDEFQNY